MSAALRDQWAAIFSGGDSVGQVGSAKASGISNERVEPTTSRCELIRCRLLSTVRVDGCDGSMPNNYSFSDFDSHELLLVAVWLQRSAILASQCFAQNHAVCGYRTLDGSFNTTFPAGLLPGNKAV